MSGHRTTRSRLLSRRARFTFIYTAFFVAVLVLLVVAARPLLPEGTGSAPGDAGWRLLPALPAAVLAGGFTLWLLAGRLLAPVQEMSEVAQTVSPDTIGERIDVVDEHEQPDEISRLQSELNDALARLESGFRAQERFVGNVAHDLKTPIAVVLAESQAIKGGVATREEYEQFVASVEEEMQRLGRLVESFLTLKRAEQGRDLVRHESVPIFDVVLDATRHCGAFAEHHEVRLVLNLPDPDEAAGEPADLLVEGDPELLRTMIDNVVLNAVRFSPPGEIVDLRVALDGDVVVITVRDRGPGVPPDRLDDLFDRFAQASPARDRAGGAGLGLAIARRVVDLHGGTIGVENLTPKGCVFTVRLPLAASDTAV